MTKSEWVLSIVGKSPHCQSADDMTASFERYLTSTAGVRKWKETVCIVVESDGLTKLYHNGILQSVKAHKRARLYELCCHANAYVRMTGSVDGFPVRAAL